MSKRYSYTEMLLEVSTAFTAVDTSRIIGSGTVIGVSVDLIAAESPDTVARVTLAFFSSNNPSGAPLGNLIQGQISRLSGERWDGRVFMLPDMALVLNVNSNNTCSATAAILVEHEVED